ncbi:MAG: hypothetical protein HOW73_18465 [Polyangiaceae bacterium]|nr:hypothetical protein [Polyangiaceae bacterium]
MSFADILGRALVAAGRSEEEARAVLPRLVATTQEALAAHRDLAVDSVAFATHLAAGLAEDVSCTLEASLASLHAADLLLAFACANRMPGAADRLAHMVGPEIDRINANQKSLRLSNAELRQLVLERLLVAPPGEVARIVSFSGRGPLKAWVRVAATRIALDLARKKGDKAESPSEGSLFDKLPGSQDPEMAYMRTLYGSELQRAFEAAFARLTARQRTVLRQRFSEQLTGDSIATMHGVHRATVFGWIEDARKLLLQSIRDELRSRVRGSDETLDSVMALVAGGLDVSVRRLLGADAPNE